MKFLVDNALSPRVAESLKQRGHDAVHVRDLGMGAASDEAILARAAAEARTIITADTDFGTLLARPGARGPSLILFRKGTQRNTAAVMPLLDAHLPSFQSELTRGAIVVVEPDRYRIRSLPVFPSAADG